MAPTLTQVLRGQSDDELAALLRVRPDLVVPVPRDLSALAARAQSRSSVARVLDRLDRFHLEILDALRLTRDEDGLTSLAEVLAITAVPPAGADAATVRAAVRRLRAYLLAYGPDPELRVVATVDEILGPYPGGLGRPAAALPGAVTDVLGDPARLRRTLLSAPPAARAVLDRLAAGPPVGTTSETEPVDGAFAGATKTGHTPVAWLVSHGLLVAIGGGGGRSGEAPEGAVELPREVGLLLRRDTGPLGALHPAPPAPAAAPVALDAVDAAGAGQAMEAVRMAAALLEAMAAEPVPVLRGGPARSPGRTPGRGRADQRGRGGGDSPGRGMGIRDLRRLARAAGTEEPLAALLVEVSYAAGLVGEAETAGSAPAGSPELRPAAGYDTWSGAPLAARWHALATGWLAMTRQPGLIGQRDTDRVVGPLSPAAERTGAPASRRTVFGVLAALPPGTAPTADEVQALVDWHAPRRAGSGTVPQLLTEAAALGLTGRVGETGGARGAEPSVGSLTSYGAELLAETGGPPPEPDDDPLGVRAGDTPAGLTPAAAKLDALLPPPVDEVLVQADLTVVVPGPPEPALAAELELVTDHESAGGASVHRVTRDSLRRALDAGYTAEDLHAVFARRSRTPVPQALRYLVDDVARAHGGLRVGSAGAYLRSDDEALVVQALADRRLASLGLRRLAPTVLATAAGSGRLLAALRDAGYAPVPEDASGAAVLVRPRARRAPARSPVTAPVDPLAPSRMSTPRLLGIVEDIRRGDAVARAERRAPITVRGNGVPSTGLAAVQAHTEALAVLQQAVREKVLVWVGYVDSHGETTSRLLRPVSIGAGYLRAEDERTDTLHTFALHRITAAALDA